MITGIALDKMVSMEWMKVEGAVVGLGALRGLLGIGTGVTDVSLRRAKSIAEKKTKGVRSKGHGRLFEMKNNIFAEADKTFEEFTGP